MQIIENTTEFQLTQATAVTIGKFDGLHRGHTALLSCILAQKSRGLTTVVFTFQPTVAAFFGCAEEKELTTLEEKRQLFEHMGIDILIEFPLNMQTAAISPEAFVRDILKKQMKVQYLAAGADLSFGYQGKGDKFLLERMAKELGFDVKIIDKLYQGKREISSSYVREEVEKGNMSKAYELLGRHYSIEGIVEAGQRLGRRLGMPTLNLYPQTTKLLPPMGVYYSQVLFEGGTYPGITNIGHKPTVNDTTNVSVETFLYDFDRDMYGKKIITELLQFKRREQKFESVAALKQQMECDIEEGRRFHDVPKGRV